MTESADKIWQILFAGTDEKDCQSLQDMLNQAQRWKFELDWAASYQASQHLLQTNHYDAVLVAADLGGQPGASLIREAASTKYPAPLILLRDEGNLAASLDALEAGAIFSLVKAEITPATLERAIHTAIQGKAREIELQEKAERFQTVWEITSDAMSLSDPQGKVIAVNPAYCRLYGYTTEEIAGKNFAVIFPEEVRDWAMRQYLEVFANPIAPPQYEATIQRKDGQQRIVDSRIGFVTQDQQRKAMLSVIRDITERERLLEEARRQKELLERLIQDAPVGIAVLEGPEHRFTLVNKLQRQLFPTIAEFIGRTVAEIWPKQEDYFTPVLDQVYQSGVPYYAVDAPWQTDKGQGLETAYYTFSYSPLFGPDQTVAGILVLSIDTSEQVINRQQIENELAERKKIEASLRESEARFQIALKNSPILVYTTDQDLRYTWIYNPAFNYPLEEVLGKTDEELNDPENVAELVALKRAVLESGIGSRKEIRLCFQDQVYHYDVTVEPISEEDGQISGLTVAAIDITDKKQYELTRLNDRIHIELQRRLLDQREQERQQIARDLHDGSVQELNGILFTMHDLLLNENNPESIEQLQSIRKTVQGLIHKLRDYIGELRPPVLKEWGLGKAIRSHLRNFQKKYPALSIHFPEGAQDALLPEEMRLALFRIYQESLTNIVKHAQATEVQIELHIDQQQVVLKIQDNGVGLNKTVDWLDLARNKHLGLVGMRERAEAVGGQIEIQSGAEGGTTITVQAPLPPKG